MKAWDLAADWWWVGEYEAYTENGRTGYEQANITNSERSIRLSRLVPGATINDPPHQVNRYVPWDTPVILKRRES